MWKTWWNCPGPGGGVTNAGGDLRDGRSVVVGLPSGVPPGFADVLSSWVGEHSILAWRRIDAQTDPELQQLPALLVAQKLCPGAGIVDAKGLATSHLLQETVVLVHGLTAASWPAWTDFLEKFELFRRNAAPVAARFCIVLEGIVPVVPDSVRAGISVRLYRGLLSSLDLRLFLRRLGKTSTEASLLARLREELLVELAGFDPALALDLSASPTQRLLSPEAALLEYCRARGWSRDAPPPLEWASGGADEVDGETRVHLAVAQLRGRSKDVSRAVWRAQLRCLFPLIEEERIRLLELHGHRLRFPITTRDGLVTEQLDVEIGILARELNAAVDGRTRRHLWKLKDARNALAHLRAVEDGDLKALEAGIRAERT